MTSRAKTESKLVDEVCNVKHSGEGGIEAQLVDDVKEMIAHLDARLGEVASPFEDTFLEEENQEDLHMEEMKNDLSSAGSVSSVESPSAWRQKNAPLQAPDGQKVDHPFHWKSKPLNITEGICSKVSQSDEETEHVRHGMSIRKPAMKKRNPANVKTTRKHKVTSHSPQKDVLFVKLSPEEEEEKGKGEKEGCGIQGLSRSSQENTSLGSSQPKKGMPLLRQRYDFQPSIGILSTPQPTPEPTIMGPVAGEKLLLSSTHSLQSPSANMTKRDKFPKEITVRDAQSSVEPVALQKHPSKIRRKRSGKLIISSGEPKTIETNKDDLPLEEFLETLKYLKRSPKVSKKTFRHLWRKRWEKELKDSRDHNDVPSDPKVKLITRLREMARTRKLPGVVDYSASFCLFEMIFSVAWTQSKGAGNPLVALDNQAKEIRRCREFFIKRQEVQEDLNQQEGTAQQGMPKSDTKKRNDDCKYDKSLVREDCKLLSEEDENEDKWKSLGIDPYALIICVSEREDVAFTVKMGAVAAFRGSNEAKECHTDIKKSSTLKNEDTDGTKHQIHFVTYDGMRSVGFWNILWTWSRPSSIDFDSLLVWQRVNHFPESLHLTRKDSMKYYIEDLATSRHGESFRIIPETYALPEQFDICHAAVTMSHSAPWIVKPNRLSRGRGIYIINHPSMIPDSGNVIVSRYIASPLLIDGFKFDLRLYVLVTSFQPLEVFLYQKGFARLASQRYQGPNTELDNPFVHLTNTSIQRKSGENHSSHFGEQGKMTLEDCLDYLENTYKIDIPNLMKKIRELVLASLVSVNHAIAPNRNCFEVFGFDVLVDQHFRPWLMEINSSPSLNVSSSIDKKVKVSLIRDVLRIVDPIPYDRRRLASLFLRRMKTGQWASSMPTSTQELRENINLELSSIAGNRIERDCGGSEMPSNLGHFLRIAPSDSADRLLALKRRIQATYG
eukprot:CAMPEP_0184486188 /NCGR_PEP_ID=MMETSP0113_2-20130426/7723_1 /TAXON_ID=91329 /ORGANISM="Norrisiella sphaerica, Strain BC52" /LENGTH=949 /DNA_ID=CAMNT_0026867947 /DNA_START=293 /DNA_END=3142 /DNA_ORIENTATION=+